MRLSLTHWHRLHIGRAVGIRVARLSALYVASIVGAGFASGREIFHFFTTLGDFGLWAAACSAVWFVLLGVFMMDCIVHWRAAKFEDVLRAAFGATVARCGAWTAAAFLLTTLSVVVAGGGALIQHLFQMSSLVGSMVVSAVALYLAFGAGPRVGRVSIWLVPYFSAMALALGIVAIVRLPWPTAVSLTMPQPWWWSGMVYASYNVLLASLVLPAASVGASRREARMAGALGGLAVGCLSLALVLAAHRMSHLDVPLPALHIARDLSPLMYGPYAVALLAAVVTSSAAYLYGFGQNLPGRTKTAQSARLLIAAGMAMAISSWGIRSLVARAYPAMGIVAFLLFLALAWTRIREWHG